MNTTTICLSCYEECTTVETGDHTQIKMDVSSCCGESFKEVDSDLVEWHRDLKRIADATGQSWQINNDPETEYYIRMFDQGVEPEEAITDLADMWDSSLA
jgi:hypothetical protein